MSGVERRSLAGVGGEVSMFSVDSELALSALCWKWQRQGDVSDSVSGLVCMDGDDVRIRTYIPALAMLAIYAAWVFR